VRNRDAVGLAEGEHLVEVADDLADEQVVAF
jgi:hypothetical protein